MNFDKHNGLLQTMEDLKENIQSIKVKIVEK